MMAVTNHSSFNKSEIDFLEKNLENYSAENQYFLGYFDWKRDELRICSRSFFLLVPHACKEDLTLKGVKSQEAFEKR